MKAAVKIALFLLVIIYTSSFALCELKRKNRLGAAAVVLTEILAAVLFVTYSA